MQRKTQQMTLPRDTSLRVRGKMPLRSIRRRLTIATVGAVLLVAVRTLARSKIGPGPGQAP